MCVIASTLIATSNTADPTKRLETPYSFSKLNPTTYIIVHNDSYIQYPFIYLKLYPALHHAVLIDTGCGVDNAKDKECRALNLKEFIEEFVIPDFSGAGDVDVDVDDNIDAGARATANQSWSYSIIITHCHFDHICGITPFTDSPSSTPNTPTTTTQIYASSHDRNFLDPHNIPSSSLCANFNLPTPDYTISTFVKHEEWLHHSRNGESSPLNLQILLTPGHTPDSLSIYDASERFLFVGDTCYKRVGKTPWGETQDAPLIFPLHGNWREFGASMEMLCGFVGALNGNEAQNGNKLQRITLSAGHTTPTADAETVLTGALTFFHRVKNNKVPIVARLPGDQIAPGGTLGDATFVFWQDEREEEAEFSMLAPEGWVEEFEIEIARA